MDTIRKAVFPVAGLGSRFLPATKAVAKEMLPIVDKPLIQYAVEEAIEAGCTDMVFVTGRTKKSIEDHFDIAIELQLELERKQETTLLQIARDTAPENISFSFIRQSRPLGLGHAILCAHPVVGNEPFAVILPDDMVDHEIGCLKQMVQARYRCGGSLVAVEEIPLEQVSNYGIVEIGSIENNLSRIQHMVEKPSPEKAPSSMAVIGRYILQPEIFTILKNTGKGAEGEIQLTDGIVQLARQQKVHAFQFEGTRYDCGSKLGFLKATVQYALGHETLGSHFREYLKTL